MAGRSIRPGVRAVALVGVAALALSGCQLVSRVVTRGGDGPIVGVERALATCSLLRLGADVGGSVTSEDLDTASRVILSRVVALGATEATVTVVLPDQLVLGLPAGDDAAWRVAAVRPGTVAFVPVPEEFDGQVVDGQPLPDGMDATPILTHEDIEGVAPVEDQMGSPSVSLTLGTRGAAAFDEWAAENVGRRFAIVVDGVVVSAPVIRSPRFDGQAQISGSFTDGDVDALVAMLGSGPLPVSVIELATTPPENGICPAVGIVQ